jgi:radical SAM protein with 4Fe4S-binding SPASM domain
MISITKLYCGVATSGDVIRYGEGGADESFAPARPASAGTAARQRRPVVVWNVTRRCNLDCIHCYSDSADVGYSDELTTEEAKCLLRDLAEFGVPALLVSGGEPLIRPDVFQLIAFAGSLGLRVTVSTNGTLITSDVARRLRESGVAYVGISIDGIGEVNDRFRRKAGAFDAALGGIRACIGEGVRVGLRLTLTRHNVSQVEQIFDLVEREGIDRLCFYHLVYSGRGGYLKELDLSHQETRQVLDTILRRTEDLCRRGVAKDVLTVDNHVDGVYVYLKLREKDPERAERVLQLLTWNGGGLYSSGVGIGCVDWRGDVHPDQFWLHYSLGNVRERKFSEIWSDKNELLLEGLRNRRARIKGRCARCTWFDACGGSLRVRADLIHGDPWAPDPACYLTDEEIQ